MNTNELLEKAEGLSRAEKSDEIIALITGEILKNVKNKEDLTKLYILRGTAWYNKNEYDKALIDYSNAIENSSSSALAFYNRAFTYIKKEEYSQSVENFNEAIRLYSNDDKIPLDLAMSYSGRASAFSLLKEYEKAIFDYNKAIDIYPNYAYAYYNIGLVKIKKYNIAPVDDGDNKELEEIRCYFHKYRSHVDIEQDGRIKHAMYYEKYIDDLIKYKELPTIEDLIANIKNVLLVEDDCVIHYTSLSALKNLILENTKFRLSEGNSLNDPLEGKDFFKFLDYAPESSCDNSFYSEKFSPKPFIGSFVTEDKYNDLNMWRLYGKEDGVEAKGCSVALYVKKFINAIRSSLLTIEEDYIKYENDIQFYRIAYLKATEDIFYIPDLSSEKNNELKNLMLKLKSELKNAKNGQYLEKYLNSIAFLFKNDIYKNENEVRMVIKGVEFAKETDINRSPHRVYIELESIRNTVKKITLGPKMDKAHEWASVFHYSYKIDHPEITVSLLPYK